MVNVLLRIFMSSVAEEYELLLVMPPPFFGMRICIPFGEEMMFLKLGNEPADRITWNAGKGRFEVERFDWTGPGSRLLDFGFTKAEG